MTLYLTRHGETAENAAGLVQGRGLDPDLNSVGRAQADALARRLADVPLAAIATSTQARSKATAAPALAMHAGAVLIVRDGLDEMDWGVHEGRGFTPASRDVETATDYERLNLHWNAGETSLRVEGGESPNEVWARVRPVLSELGASYPDDNVLVVTHRRLLRILLAGVLPGGGLERMMQYPHPNAALSVLDVPGGILGPDVRLVTLADTSFLSASAPDGVAS